MTYVEFGVRRIRPEENCPPVRVRVRVWQFSSGVVVIQPLNLDLVEATLTVLINCDGILTNTYFLSDFSKTKLKY